MFLKIISLSYFVYLSHALIKHQNLIKINKEINYKVDNIELNNLNDFCKIIKPSIDYQEKLNINFKEVKETIKYNINDDDKEIINKINGFYGMVGPDINMNNVKTLYELFTGNGNIQGVFFDNGEITFVKHYIKTEKIIYESKYGELNKSILFSPFYIFLYKIGILPNILGLANTAFLKVKNSVYVLFERDYPYKIDIDFIGKQINTIKKINIPGLDAFSGHSKFNNNKIDTIDYNIVKSSVSYYKLTDNFELINKVNINTKYSPIIHDFYMLDDSILFTDSPLFIDINLKELCNLPISLKDKPTYIHVKNINDLNENIYESKESFFIFHYAYINNNDDNIEIFAPLCYNLDFSKLDLKTYYSKLIINKSLKTVEIKTNPELNHYNLDFPILYEDKVILRNIDNNSINGFIICKELDIVQKLFFEDKKICGEPSIINIENISYLIFFAYNNSEQSFIMLVNLNNYKVIEIPLKHKINIGFHSIFLEK
jgi:hypothetical protein